MITTMFATQAHRGHSGDIRQRTLLTVWLQQEREDESSSLPSRLLSVRLDISTGGTFDSLRSRVAFGSRRGATGRDLATARFEAGRRDVMINSVKTSDASS